MAYDIDITDEAFDELKAIRVYDRRRIVEKVKEQLKNEPTKETRNRKPLSNLVPDFEHEGPIWELRIGEFRVFYDVNEKEELVSVRAVRRKAQGQTTKDITHEEDNS